MGRAGYYVDVQFFADSEETTRVHWYKVPRDRPCLPVASFVNSFDWVSDLGPRSVQWKGEPPGFQGERWAPTRPYDRRTPPSPGERYTGYYCGSESQWQGNLLIGNSRDHGEYGCCLPADAVGPACGCGSLSGSALGGIRVRGQVCGCGSASGSVTGYGFPSGTVCGCGAVLGAALGGVREAGTVCGCGAVNGSASLVAFPAGTVCGCGAVNGSAVLIGAAIGTVCGCGAVNGSATGPIVGTVCGCGAVIGSAAFDAFPAGLVCGCGKIEGSANFTPMVTYTCGNLTPLGSTQSGAALIITDNAFVAECTVNNQGVRLPASCSRIVVQYAGSLFNFFTMLVYPPSGGKIDGGATDAPMTIGVSDTRAHLFVTTDALNYKSFLSV